MTSISPEPPVPDGNQRARPSGATGTRLWAGRILTAVPVLFLIVDGVIKLMRIQPVVDGMRELGFAISLAVPIGILLLSCVAVYLIPRTSILGAILLTGYLGGAVASQLRVGTPVFSHLLFPIYIGLMLWGGLYLRDARLRAVIPFRGDKV